MVVQILKMVSITIQALQVALYFYDLFLLDVLLSQDYFNELGYPVRVNVNPSDHYLDVIDDHNKRASDHGKNVQRSLSTSSEATDSAMRSLGEMWTVRQQSITSTDGSPGVDRSISSQVFTPRKPPNFFIQFLFFLRRAFVLQVWLL